MFALFKNCPNQLSNTTFEGLILSSCEATFLDFLSSSALSQLIFNMADFIALNVLQKSLLEGIQHSLSPIIFIHPLQVDFETNKAINCRGLLSRGSREWKELEVQMIPGWKAGMH